MQKIQAAVLLLVITFVPAGNHAIADTDRWIIRYETDVDISKKLEPDDVQELAVERTDFLTRNSDLASLREPSSIVRTYSHVPYVAIRASRSDIEVLRDRNPDLQIWKDRQLQALMDDVNPLIGNDELIESTFENRGNSAAIVIVDTGVDGSHPDLDPALYLGNHHYCFSSSSGSLCPNGSAAQSGHGAAEACQNNAPPRCDHGTHVSSIAATRHYSDNRPYEGISRATIIPMNTFHITNDCDTQTPPCIRTFTSNVIAALNQTISIVDGGTRVAALNMSLGGGQYGGACDGEPMLDVAQALDNRNVAVIASSGNDGYTGHLGWPACLSPVFAVGASTKYDTIWSGTNINNELDLLAPGASITAADYGGGHTIKTGTSMAAPVVTGAIANLKHLLPNLDNADIYNRLTSLATTVLTRGSYSVPRIDISESAMDLIDPYTRITINDNGGEPSYDYTGTISSRYFVPLLTFDPCRIRFTNHENGTEKNYEIYDHCVNSLISGDGSTIAALVRDETAEEYILAFFDTDDPSGSLPTHSTVIPGSFIRPRLDEITYDGLKVTILDASGDPLVGTYDRTLEETTLHYMDHNGNPRMDCFASSISGDGGTLAYVCPGATNPEIFIRDLGTDNVEYLIGGTQVSLCHDGSAAAIIGNDDLIYHVDLSTYELTQVANFLYTSPNSVHLVEACDTVFFSALPEPVTGHPPTRGVFSVHTQEPHLVDSHCLSGEGVPTECMVGESGDLADLGGYQCGVSSICYIGNFVSPGGQVVKFRATDNSGNPFLDFDSKSGTFSRKYILPPPSQLYSIGFDVVGLEGDGLAVSLNGTETMSIDSTGSYVFDNSYTDGSNYIVTVASQPSSPNQDCTVLNGSGTIEGGDVTDILIQCQTLHYTVGGQIYGLEGTGLTAQLNDQPPVGLQGSNFTFPPLPDASSYDVQIVSQPENPDQVCQTLNGTGVLAGADIDDLEVHCVNDSQPDADALAFGNVTLGDSPAFDIILLTATGPAPLSITSVQLQGSDVFSLDANTCNGATIEPGETCEITLVLTPHTEGLHLGGIQVHNNGLVDPYAVDIAGTVIDQDTLLSDSFE